MRVPKTRYAVVALLSATLVALEVVWTRILSAEFFYTFAFLVISLAVLGLGLGALATRLLPALAGGGANATLLLAAGATALVAPPLVLQLGLDFSRLLQAGMLARLAAAVALLALPFALAGAALAQVFRSGVEAMPRLYMADLLGAGGGALLAVLAMNTVQVPRAAALAALPVVAAGLLLARRRRLPAALGSLALAVVAVAAMPRLLPEIRQDRARLGPVLYEDWNAMGRLKVHEPDAESRVINLDNGSVAPVFRFDGRFDEPVQTRGELTERVRDLLGGRPGYRMVSLGAGGGRDVLQGLAEGAGEIHAVEVNPGINRLLTEGLLRDYSGGIYLDPRVKVVTEDARAYLRRFEGRFDAILSWSSNSFAALASGAFALSENYLFTTEAFEDYLRALAPGGVLVMEHQFYVPRAVSEALIALRRQGVVEPERHVAVYDLAAHRRMVLLVSRAPLAPAQIDAFFGPLAQHDPKDLRLLWPVPEGGDAGSLVARVVRNGWEAEAARAPIDIRPCSDDRPFAAQMGLLRNVTRASLGKLLPYEAQGFPLARLIVGTILAVVALLGAPLLALPRLLRKQRLGAVPALYFAALGAGFMALEVVLIQQFTLLVGASSSTFVAILLALLVSSGVGSRFASRTPPWVPFAAVAAWVALDVLFFPALVRAAGGLPTGARLAVAVAAVLPLGFFLGQPFPKGALRVGERVDWGFAVNGVASVVGSAGVLLVAMTFGFRVALLASAGVYALAGGLLAWRDAWAVGPERLPAPVGVRLEPSSAGA